MTFQEIQLAVAENLGILAADESTIEEGKVTLNGIKNAINRIYREKIFQILANKYQQDFEVTTADINTYTATGNIDGATTGTTLVATTGVFANTDVGYTVQNVTKNETVKIAAFINATTVTVDADISTWSASDEFYVLGNVYYFGGDAVDLKEIIQVGIKYSATDSNYTIAKREQYEHLIQYGNESFSEAVPYFYLTSIKISGALKRAIGVFPHPSSYQGLINIKYVEKPPKMTNNTDEPILGVVGVSEALIDGTTAWGFRISKDFDAAREYQTLFADDLATILRSYRPKSRSGARKLKVARYISSMRRRTI